MDVTSTQEINFPSFECSEIKDSHNSHNISLKSEICYETILNCRYTLNLDSGKKNNW